MAGLLMLSRVFQKVFFAFLCLFCASCIAEQNSSEDLLQAKSLAAQALEAWKSSDWEGMYNCLSEKDREQTSLEEFAKKRASLANSRKLQDYTIKEVSKADDQSYNVAVTLLLSENYNARYQFDGEEQKLEYEVDWKIVSVDNQLYLTFVK